MEQLLIAKGEVQHAAVMGTPGDAQTRDSQTSTNEVSNTPGDFQESDSSVEEPEDYVLPAKRSSRSSRHSQTERKRRNAGESSGMGRSHGSADTSVEQSEKWSWANGKFRCYRGKEFVKEQKDTPADGWIYFDQGWPGREGKNGGCGSRRPVKFYILEGNGS